MQSPIVFAMAETTRWEYMLANPTADDYDALVKQLNAFGREGWEAVGFGAVAVRNPQPDAYRSHNAFNVMLFKRTRPLDS
jgi:hypothetical protein